MDPMDPSTYGERVADLYDELFDGILDTAAAVECLVGLAGGGPVLELAVGTGRLAIPLAEQGIAVHGIDASPAMLAQLRAKPGGDSIQAVFGDLADVGVDGQFPLVLVAFNTLFVLLDPDEQARCFRNVAARLVPGGRFVVEAFVPDVTRYDDDEKRLGLRRVTGDHAYLEASVHDPTTQRVDTLQIRIGDDGIRTWPVQLRYSYPAELDAMAATAGLELEARWADWSRTTFSADSGGHVSVYRRPSVSGA